MQIVGYEPGPEGALLIATEGTVEREPLEIGSNLSYALADRHCAGVGVPDNHTPCDRATAPYCEEHASTWICALCTGTCLKDEMDCDEPHAVYLAAFAPTTFKVGVTKEWRLETRLREQGADRGARIHVVPDGRIARELEAEIASTVPDRVSVSTKLHGLARSVDDAAWESLCSRFDPDERFTFEYGFDLSVPPIPETIATGTVVGTKGRALVLDHAGSTYAVDMRDLVGYEIEPGSIDRELQSGLGAFG